MNRQSFLFSVLISLGTVTAVQPNLAAMKVTSSDEVKMADTATQTDADELLRATAGLITDGKNADAVVNKLAAPQQPVKQGVVALSKACLKDLLISAGGTATCMSSLFASSMYVLANCKDSSEMDCGDTVFYASLYTAGASAIVAIYGGGCFVVDACKLGKLLGKKAITKLQGLPANDDE